MSMPRFTDFSWPCPCPRHVSQIFSWPRPCPRHVFPKTSCPCHVHDRGVDMDTGVHLVRDHVHLTLIPIVWTGNDCWWQNISKAITNIDSTCTNCCCSWDFRFLRKFYFYFFSSYSKRLRNITLNHLLASLPLKTLIKLQVSWLIIWPIIRSQK